MVATRVAMWVNGKAVLWVERLGGGMVYQSVVKLVVEWVVEWVVLKVGLMADLLVVWKAAILVE